MKYNKEEISKEKYMIKIMLGTPNKILSISKHISITALNVSSLNSPVQRLILTDRIEKLNPIICCLQKTAQWQRHPQIYS